MLYLDCPTYAFDCGRLRAEALCRHSESAAVDADDEGNAEKTRVIVRIGI